MTTHHQQQISDDADRQNRFASQQLGDHSYTNLRERAASQPPRTSIDPFPPPSPIHRFDSQLYGGGPASPIRTGGGSWGQRMAHLAQYRTTPSPSLGLPSSVPTRSSSFSLAMRESQFSSTFEDDESEALSDGYGPFDEPYDFRTPRRGSDARMEIARSRSQSLAARPAPIGSPIKTLHSQGSAGLASSWAEPGSHPLSIPGSRYAPPGIRNVGFGNNGSLTGRSPTTTPGIPPFGGSYRQDMSNMSPFMRDVGQILLDDGSAFRELWGANMPRDAEGNGLASGTTSRRHSVSVVQPRRPVAVGFGATGLDDAGSAAMPAQTFGSMISDDELASDLGLLNLDGPGPPPRGPPGAFSQPSSLPIYAPLAHPVIEQPEARYGGLAVPYSSGRPNVVRQTSEGTSSQASSSPTNESHTFGAGNGIQGTAYSFKPATTLSISSSYGRGTGFATSPTAVSPVSPSALRSQQPAFFSQPAPPQRRPSTDAASPGLQPPLAELGRGVPLHAVPSSVPLYIVEFKAGRTDLFYCAEQALDIKVGDLVIVEADRGKDLGKVVNDSISHAEVEAFARQSKIASSDVSAPGGPAATVPSKRDINPKRIYSKAQQQDTQLLLTKMQDEDKALQLCQSKVRQKKLPMEVIDAEYQWDRRKLTFYFVSDKRIDFRELVRELFRLYKTRIWMASLQGPGAPESPQAATF